MRVWDGRSVADLQRTWDVPALHVLARTGSTNDLARAAAPDAAAGTTFIADAQSAGRGQHGRRWESAPGTSLLMSVILHAPAAAPALGAAPLHVGLAVAEAIDQTTGLQASLKWPNDVLLGGRKVAGILCEGMHAADGSVVIAGIGINVLQQPSDFSSDVAPHATSLQIVTGIPVSRADLAERVLRALRGHHDHIGEPLTDEQMRAFTARDILRDRPVTIDGVPAGIADGIGADGALHVRSARGVQRVHGGTVRILDATGVAHERAP